MPVLKVDNLSKSFENEQVLKSVSFELEKGEVLAIIGSSGGGKTTLLRCLNQLIIPDEGVISVNDDIIFDSSLGKENSKNLRKKRLHFGLVFQQFNLFPQYTVLGNLTLAATLAAKSKPDYNKAKDAQIEENALKLLERVGLTDKKNSYPCELSGGQQQRVAIARALMLTPDILCFDEPTSALDPELTREVLRVIESLKSNDSTMVVVTHEMEFARRVATKVMFIADGVIEEFGTPEEVFEHPKSEKLKSFFNNSVEVVPGKNNED